MCFALCAGASSNQTTLTLAQIMAMKPVTNGSRKTVLTWWQITLVVVAGIAALASVVLLRVHLRRRHMAHAKVDFSQV